MKPPIFLLCLSLCVVAACGGVAKTPAAGDVITDELSSGGNGPEMVVLPAGTFTMGDIDGRKDEQTTREITLPNAFAVGKTEVTWLQWTACRKVGGCRNITQEKAGGGNGFGKGTRPVIEVSLADAKAYAEWLSKETGASYRLLSEAEWEYAARAGTQTNFSFGDSLTAAQANFDPNKAPEGEQDGEFVGKTAPVGSYPANAFGLHDMHGNVWEWVADCYKPYNKAVTHAKAVTRKACEENVVRGGSWAIGPGPARSANRSKSKPNSRSHRRGFRVARDLDDMT